MNLSTASDSGDASITSSNRDENTAVASSNRQERWTAPLPQSGADLAEVFYNYTPAIVPKSTAKGQSDERLTWSSLKNDQNCQELSGLRALVSTIFAYSNGDKWNDMSKTELAAGFRYFLPTGSLALEWVQFFAIAPHRYLDMAPMEVRRAYERERKRDENTISMRDLVTAEVAAWRLELAGAKLEAPFFFNQPSKTLKRKRQRSELSDPAEHMVQQPSPMSDKSPVGNQDNIYIGHTSPCNQKDSSMVNMPSLSQPYIAQQPYFGSMDSISMGVGLERAAGSPYFMMENAVAPTEAIPTFTASVNKRQRREVAQDGGIPSWSVSNMYSPTPNGTAFVHFDPSVFRDTAVMDPVLHTGDPVQTVLSPGALASPVHGLSGPLEQDSLDQDIATPQKASSAEGVFSGQQAAQHAAAAVSASQVPMKAHSSSTPAPGSQTHRGKGFCQKGWSEDRVKAWTDIQGRLTGDLPSAALSRWGDEMSRGHTPKSVDPRCCPFETTMEENLTYFTLATTMNRQMCSRAMANWTAQECVHFVYSAHDLQDSHSYGRTTVQKQFGKCKQWESQNPLVLRTANMSNLRPDNNLTGADKDTHDYFLYAMGKNVANHPTGQGRHNLTMVIEHVIANDAKTVRLSEAAQYARDNNLALLSQPRLLVTPVTNDGPDATQIANARAAYVAKFGKPA